MKAKQNGTKIFVHFKIFNNYHLRQFLFNIQIICNIILIKMFLNNFRE